MKEIDEKEFVKIYKEIQKEAQRLSSDDDNNFINAIIQKIFYDYDINDKNKRKELVKYIFDNCDIVDGKIL